MGLLLIFAKLDKLVKTFFLMALDFKLKSHFFQKSESPIGSL